MARALRRSIAVRLVTLAAMALAAGCSFLPTIAYIIKPEDVPAEFDGLNGKRVAVICRATSLEYAHPTVSRDLALRVGALLTKHGRKVEVIDERELADWVDKHDWHDYGEVGRALKADLVVGMHADGATRVIVEYAGKYRIPFAVVPCCSDNGMPYKPWVRHLAELGREQGLVVEEAELPMDGRARVILGAPA